LVFANAEHDIEKPTKQKLFQIGKSNEFLVKLKGELQSINTDLTMVHLKS
jgi:hypothetical protein